MKVGRLTSQHLSPDDIKRSSDVKMQVFDALPLEVRRAIQENPLGVPFPIMQKLLQAHRAGVPVAQLLNAIAAGTARTHADLVAKGLTPP
jgi:hypothetical protein